MTPKDPLNDLDNIVGGTPAQAMPDSAVMVSKGLEVLSQSTMSFSLVEMVEKEGLNIYVINTKREVSYVPETKDIYIGVTVYNPTHPARFILLLADALLEVQLELEGFKQPSLAEPKEKYVSATAEKKAKKVAHLCSIAFDLDQKEQFLGYKFIDVMHEMGHNNAIDVFIGNI